MDENNRLLLSRIFSSIPRASTQNASLLLVPFFVFHDSPFTFNALSTTFVSSRTRVFFPTSRAPRQPVATTRPRTLTSSWHPSSATPVPFSLTTTPVFCYRALNRTNSAAFRFCFSTSCKVSHSHPLDFFWSASLQASVAFLFSFLATRSPRCFNYRHCFYFLLLHLHCIYLHLPPSTPVCTMNDHASFVPCHLFLSLHSCVP